MGEIEGMAKWRPKCPNHDTMIQALFLHVMSPPSDQWLEICCFLLNKPQVLSSESTIYYIVYSIIIGYTDIYYIYNWVTIIY